MATTYSDLFKRLDAVDLEPIVARHAEHLKSETAEVEREALLGSCIHALTELDFSADDLRFIFVLITALTCVRPAGLFAQLRKSAAAGPA